MQEAIEDQSKPNNPLDPLMDQFALKWACSNKALSSDDRDNLADQLGVGKATVRRWMKDERVIQRVNKYHQEFANQAKGAILSLGIKGLNELAKIAEDIEIPSENRVKAASKLADLLTQNLESSDAKTVDVNNANTGQNIFKIFINNGSNIVDGV